MGRNRTTRLVARRGAGQRGAVLVELAIVLPLLFALLFGIVDFGNAYNDYISVRQGARDGTRQAVTGRIGTDASCTIVGGSFPGDAPSATAVRRVVCLTKARVGLTPADIRVAIRVNDPAGTDRGSIAVCVMYPLRSISGFFAPILNGQALRTEVQMRTEQTVVEAGGTGILPVSFEETALSGQNWAFCVAENT